MINNYRFERKIPIYKYSVEFMEQVLKSHPLGFKRQYPKRLVHNIYYDDEVLTFYNQNINGDANRIKIRARWYNRHFRPVIEIKKKKGLVGTKTNILTDHKSEEQLNKRIYKEYNLKPKIKNNYEREYFVSYDKSIRITLDFNLKFFDIKGNEFYKHDKPNLILELKYDNELIPSNIFDNLNLRVKKYSKYVEAVKAVYYSK
jgi:SPX domain protein involved in polyphosphate accumulation